MYDQKKRKETIATLDALMEGKIVVSPGGVKVRIIDNGLCVYEEKSHQKWVPSTITLQQLMDGEWSLYEFDIRKSLVENINKFAGKVRRLRGAPHVMDDPIVEWLYLIMDSSNMSTYYCLSSTAVKYPNGYQLVDGGELKGSLMLAKPEMLEEAVALWEPEN